MIVNANGTNNNVRFKYIIFRGDGKILDYQSNGSTIIGHPNAKGCIAVGAMLYENIPQYTPVWPGVASFSSRGGTGTLDVVGNNYLPRSKPDIIAPNGVNTTVDLGGPAFDDGDAYPNFFGTSAAAPHAAAVAALIIEAKKKYNLQTVVTPTEVRNLLINTAGKFPNLDSFSYAGGNGYIQADSAISVIANGKPIIYNWEPGGTDLVPNGNTPFPVKIKGAYLTGSTKIYINGSPISNTGLAS